MTRMILTSILAGVSLGLVLGGESDGIAARKTGDDASSAKGAVGGGEPEVLAALRNAASAVRKNLRSGSAKGTFRKWGPKNELAQDVRFHGAFDGSEYYLNVNYQPLRPKQLPRPYQRILVCDGSKVVVSEFSEYTRSLGAKEKVYYHVVADVRNNRPATLVNVTEGFPGDIKQIAEGIFNPEILDKYEMKIEKLASGHYRGRLQRKPGSYVTFEIAPECGYHVVSAESFWSDKLSTRWITGWKKVGDLWYAKSSRREKYEAGKIREAYEVQFEKFRPNTPVSPELFRMTALELPLGARIIDRRPPEGLKPGEGYRPKIYRWDGFELDLDRKD